MFLLETLIQRVLFWIQSLVLSISTLSKAGHKLFLYRNRQEVEECRQLQDQLQWLALPRLHDSSLETVVETPQTRIEQPGIVPGQLQIWAGYMVLDGRGRCHFLQLSSFVVLLYSMMLNRQDKNFLNLDKNIRVTYLAIFNIQLDTGYWNCLAGNPGI